MKLCVLADASAYHTLRWIDYFTGHGWQVHLISLEHPILKSSGVQHLIASKIQIRSLKYPASARSIKNLIREIKPDIVNAHFVPNYGFIGALVGFRPFVISTWGSDILLSPRKSPLHRLRIQFALGRADLVTTDAGTLTRAVKKLGVPPGKIITVPMGVDLASWPERPFDKKTGTQIVSYRRLEPIYNIELFLRAIPEIRKVVSSPVRFVIAGAGSQKNNLLNLASELGVSESVRFTGALTQTELTNLVYESDLYISTSLSDTTSVSLLEAMASGLVPVVSDIPGNREWIENEKNGYLFSPRSKDQLVSQILRALAATELWQKIARANRKTIIALASWQNNMQAIEKSFIKLLSPQQTTVQ
jgi:glycosyltransferase involved in cell wall biosynthesis